MPRTLPIEDPELALSNANLAVAPGPTGPINGETLVKWRWFKPSLNLLVVIFTLNIPTLHASLGRISGGLGIRAAISVWKAIRTLDSLLIAALIAVLFKADAQATTSLWFFCACSLLQAVIGLISSTALIIYFSAYPINNENVETVDQLDFLFWNVWYLFSVPSIWTSWSVLTFTITLVINVACPTTLDGVVGGNVTDYNYSSLDPARALLIALICVSVVFFAFFLLHLRHLSRTHYSFQG
ncbi:hypothetical protein M378DRAFT_174308 [Amanita muscaria Koide BX008]|uniref:Uncharacterized protein n=1 Tax=Amanita muscaria (strain Koide BX008) TaxID=946122 RepID=A0A0C2WCK0_AMAMK|nr:hypothetical protein M378DRAFT_174308 [Amanita muscaria Koide BX008]